MEVIKNLIDHNWEKPDKGNISSNIDLQQAVLKTMDLLDNGSLRISSFLNGIWETEQWLKKAILLFFKLKASAREGFGLLAYDKVPLKCSSWNENDFKKAGFRMVPGAIVRKSAYVAPNVVLMPSFINVGAYIDENTMIDTWATVGSCAQIGKNCHISGGAGIGGVLEPLQSNPVIIENDVFIGARSEVAEGVIVGKGSVLSMGVYLGASTRIYDRHTGEVLYGKVPPYSVVVPGTLPSSKDGISTYAAIIVKKVDEKTRSKTSINELLRGGNHD